MKTELIKVGAKNKKSVIFKASNLIRAGEVVAFPTETVYGLGANAFNENAVAKIFIAKGRPADNPLIVHIFDINQLKDLVEEIPLNAKKLMKEFWPGPLTIILKKSSKVPSIVTAGLDSVAVRMPRDKIALDLIKQSNFPIAAPSANSSTKPSPTNAQHVLNDLNGKIPLILDGGKCKVGLESTVISLVGEVPTILRPGKITPKQIEKVIGQVRVHSTNSEKNENLANGVAPLSPGMKYKHYSPKAELILILPKKDFDFNGELKKLKLKGKVGVLSFTKKIGSNENNICEEEICFERNLNKMAHELFDCLREFDKKQMDFIVVEGVSEKEMGLALMNRLKKAASKIF